MRPHHQLDDHDAAGKAGTVVVIAKVGKLKSLAEPAADEFTYG